MKDGTVVWCDATSCKFNTAGKCERFEIDLVNIEDITPLPNALRCKGYKIFKDKEGC